MRRESNKKLSLEVLLLWDDGKIEQKEGTASRFFGLTSFYTICLHVRVRKFCKVPVMVRIRRG